MQWKPIAFIAALLRIWHVAAGRQQVPLLPGPIAVAHGIVDSPSRASVQIFVASLFRVTWGYVAAVLLAIPFGLLIACRRRAEMSINPLIQILRPISPLAWIPISILWFGVGDLAACM